MKVRRGEREIMYDIYLKTREHSWPAYTLEFFYKLLYEYDNLQELWRRERRIKLRDKIKTLSDDEKKKIKDLLNEWYKVTNIARKICVSVYRVKEYKKTLEKI